MIWNYLHYKNKASPLRQLPRPAPFPLHGSPLRRAACAMLAVASREPSLRSRSADLGTLRSAELPTIRTKKGRSATPDGSPFAYKKPALTIASVGSFS